MNQDNRHISPSAQFPAEREQEKSLRPLSLKEYVGQSKIKEKLEIFITACKQRGEAMDHALFCGPPGLGKTTLANIIASELGVNLRSTSAPVIDKAGDLAAILTALEPHDVLFIDEIHRLNHTVEEILYQAMEDYRLDIIIGQGPSAKTVKIDIAPFTLVGATTRTGLLTSPLRDRFGMVERLVFYTDEELSTIVSRSANILQTDIETSAALELARRSRGTPRIANRLLKRTRDYAQVKGNGKIDLAAGKSALTMLEVDEEGFDPMDRKILQTIIENFDGGPVGLDTLASTISEERHTIEEVYEPYLLQKGFLIRTPRGRIATSKAFDHMKIKQPPSSHKSQGTLV